MASPFAPVITATLSDALQTDNNNSGKADPGDTLMYTATNTKPIERMPQKWTRVGTKPVSRSATGSK